MGRRGFIALIGLALLAACSKQPGAAEGDVPDVSPVDRNAIALEGAPDQPLTSYTNDKYGFTVAVPPGWGEFRPATSEDGSIFENKALDSDLRISGAPNEGDADFQQAMEALRDGTTNVTGAMAGETEYRGAATDPEGYRIEIRLIKAPQGLITAMVRYPLKQATALSPLAQATLDSVVVAPIQREAR